MPGDTLPEGRLPFSPINEEQTLLFVDEQGNPMPAGEVGEIVVRGKSLAAGYWRNPAMTADRFLPPDGNGERTCRTGDLARIDSAGSFHFTGRTGTRFKIRGNSIELAEVTDAMCRLPGVTQAVADVVERPQHEPVLVGYVVPHKQHSWTPARLRRALRESLPDPAVPSVIIVLDHIPLSPNGKVDRERLHQLRPQSIETPQACQSDTEALLVKLWKEAFELSDVGRNDSFFDLGGDSLIAAVVAARIHDRTGVALNLGAFADHPTLAELAAVIDRHSQQDKPSEVPLVRVSRDGPLPLSLAQERIWLTSQTHEKAQSHVRSVSYRILGPLNPDALRDSISYIVRRHEILRTTFEMRNGQLTQVIHPPQPIELPFLDVVGMADGPQQAEAFFRDRTELPLRLVTLPLMRFALVRVRENEHWLQHVGHHMVSDGWSGPIFSEELALLYAARRRGELPPLPEHQNLQYADYAAWERKVLQPGSSVIKEAVEWGKNVLADGIPRMRSPWQRTPLLHRTRALWRRLALKYGLPMLGGSLSPADGRVTRRSDRDMSARLENLQRRLGATYYQLHLAAFVVLLAVELDRDDILLGSYVTNRKRLPLQGLCGMFANLMPLRFRYRPDETFQGWLSIVRDVVTTAEAHSVVPFEMLREELARQGAHPPLIEIIFQTSQASGTIELADLKVTTRAGEFKTMPWGFSLNVAPHRCEAHFDAYAYDPVAVGKLIDRYQRLLNAISRHPDRTLHELLAMSRPGGIP